MVAHGPLGYRPFSVLPTKPVELVPEGGALSRTGMAVVSFDLSSTASWPSTNRLVVANAGTR